MSPDPEHIAISKSRGISIDWKDGLKSVLSLEYLRDECPCAHCTGAHGTVPQKSNYQNPGPVDPLQLYKPRLAMDDVESVGNYALRVYWNDGHSSGIYTWEYLRALSERKDAKLPQA